MDQLLNCGPSPYPPLSQSAIVDSAGSYLVATNVTWPPKGGLTAEFAALPAPAWARRQAQGDPGAGAAALAERPVAARAVSRRAPMYLVPSGRGREALPYLLSILRHYDELTAAPDTVMLFTHGGRLGAAPRELDRAWGLEQDWAFRRLAAAPPANLSNGYASLQCREGGKGDGGMLDVYGCLSHPLATLFSLPCPAQPPPMPCNRDMGL